MKGAEEPPEKAVVKAAVKDAEAAVEATEETPEEAAKSEALEAEDSAGRVDFWRGQEAPGLQSRRR